MVGQQLGEYRIQRQLGQGRAGVVYLADDPRRSRAVAVKVLNPPAEEARGRVERFFLDAQAASAIRHFGIVSVLGRGVSPSGQPYMVMEHLEGSTLRARLASDKRLELADALRVASRVAAALGAAHDRRIVHGELRPENIFLLEGEPDRVKLCDFGLGKLLGPFDASPEGVPQALAHLSPERCQERSRIDVNDDVYSLGCVIFEMACGRPPFPEDSREAILAAHSAAPVPSPRTLEPTLPAALDGLVQAMLSKSPGDRPRTMFDVGDALVEIAAGRGLDIPALSPSRGGTSPPRITPLGHVHLRPPEKRSIVSFGTESPPRRTPLGQAHLHLRSLVVDDRPRVAIPRPAIAGEIPPPGLTDHPRAANDAASAGAGDGHGEGKDSGPTRASPSHPLHPTSAATDDIVALPPPSGRRIWLTFAIFAVAIVGALATTRLLRQRGPLAPAHPVTGTEASSAPVAPAATRAPASTH